MAFKEETFETKGASAIRTMACLGDHRSQGRERLFKVPGIQGFASPERVSVVGGFAPKATLSLAPGCGLQSQECHLQAPVVFYVSFSDGRILPPNSGNLP